MSSSLLSLVYVCDTGASGWRGASRCDRGLVNVGGARTSKVEWVEGCTYVHAYVLINPRHACMRRRVTIVGRVCASGSIFLYSNESAKKTYGSPQRCK